MSGLINWLKSGNSGDDFVSDCLIWYIECISSHLHLLILMSLLLFLPDHPQITRVMLFVRLCAIGSCHVWKKLDNSSTKLIYTCLVLAGSFPLLHTHCCWCLKNMSSEVYPVYVLLYSLKSNEPCTLLKT